MPGDVQERPGQERPGQERPGQERHGTAERAAGRAGPRWLWFGVLGGAIAWAVHLLVAWLLVELACAQGHDTVLGLPLRAVVALATVIPGVVTAVAWLVAARALHVLRRAEEHPPPEVAPRRIGRARFMAEIGAWTDGLSLLMIAFGGAAVLTLAPCAR